MKPLIQTQLQPFFKSTDQSFHLFHGDTMKIVPQLKQKFDMVFADPPYSVKVILCLG